MAIINKEPKKPANKTKTAVINENSKEKIKRMRQAGLAAEGTYSSENLAFKMLRINNELDNLNSLKISSYDKMRSLESGSAVKVKISENWNNFLKIANK